LLTYRLHSNDNNIVGRESIHLRGGIKYWFGF